MEIMEYLKSIKTPPFKKPLSEKETIDRAKSLIKDYGQKGLLERLEKIERDAIIPTFFIGMLRDMEYDRQPMLGDDFLPDTDYYNAMGAIYPTLSREQKDDALRAHLEKFDRIRYDYVQHNHTPFIREPSLLADIGIARGLLYWPGLHDEEKLWKANEKGYWKEDPDFKTFRKHLMNKKGLFNPKFIKSDFLVAYALLRKDFANYGEDYVKAANPKFLDRVLKGITGLRFARADSSQIQKGKKRLIELLPKLVHEKIEQFRQEANWANPENFL